MMKRRDILAIAKDANRQTKIKENDMKTKESKLQKEIRKNGAKLFEKYYNYVDKQNDLTIWLHVIENRADIPKTYRNFFKK